ncbi:MAG: CocE/NonD family hydrolase [Chitinophagales bacterium]|nr:CocE/NonD family hydrolase [Chitinophagales bacterium]
MNKIYTLAVIFCLSFSLASAQVPNGQLDDIKEFSTKITVPLVMPDGVKLMTDVYVPRTRDSLRVSLGTLNLGIATIETDTLTFIPYGEQLLFYDSLNGQPNPNPYQLPSVFTRTPYDKGSWNEGGSIFPILGYNYIMQDMRGRYSSEGVYFPMYSDSWNKNAYHPGQGHVLDYLPPTDPKHSNKHEDGYESVKILLQLDSAYGAMVGSNELAEYYKGLPHTNTKVSEHIGMFGASALGNTQLQLGAAHRIPDSIPGLKCLMPIVATIEHYISTGYNNGVFRDRIVTGWLKGQIFDTEDDLIPIDNDKQNSIHTSFDYDLPKTITLNGITREYQQNKFEAANISIDHFTAMRYNFPNGDLSPAGFYPNSVGRPGMDAKVAYVNQDGESVDPVTQLPLPNLTYSRYTNLDVPVMHITGWWDIFTEGQINTHNFTVDALTGKNKSLQKSVIGPWAHQTIASRKSGDRIYPKNVTEVTKFDLADFDIQDIPLNDVVKSDLVTWFRYNLNYQPGHVLGEPKFIIRESQNWQKLNKNATIFGDILVRIPSQDFIVPYADMINFLGGKGGLSGLKIEVKNNVFGQFETTQAVPNVGTILPNFGGEPLSEIPRVNYETDVPAFRFYVPGCDSAADALAGYPDNHKVGNFWLGTETFPATEHMEWKKMYMHQNGSLNYSAPAQDEGYKMYVHDPDDPILTVGGANMIVRSPDGTRNSQSQMEITDPTNAPYTMDREGVIQFNSDPIAVGDSFTIVGFPVCTLYAKSNPAGVTSGPTDAEFHVRLCDVWPDGRVYFVQDGCVGARGRDYARALVDEMGVPGAATYGNGVEEKADTEIPFTNIETGQIYEYVFKMWPIAYSWAPGHRIRVLISSSNYTRYQVNPSVPLNDGEFFRRKPGDGQFYYFQGQQMFPRSAVQRVHFSPDHPSSINFPTFNTQHTYNTVEPVAYEPSFDASVFPNPASDNTQIFVNKPGDHEVVITDVAGRRVFTGRFDDNILINTERFGSGIYFATITDVNKPADRITKRFIVE